MPHCHMEVMAPNSSVKSGSSGSDEKIAGEAAGVDAESLRERLKDTNINAQTFLATDYLNHFNEIVMILDLIPDMPDCFEDAREWQPKTYRQHFEDSNVADKDLAVVAYEHAPQIYRDPFDTTVRHMNTLVLGGIERIGAALEAGDDERLGNEVGMTSRALQRLVDVASAIIHGSTDTLEQADIDSLLA